MKQSPEAMVYMVTIFQTSSSDTHLKDETEQHQTVNTWSSLRQIEFTVKSEETKQSLIISRKSGRIFGNRYMYMSSSKREEYELINILGITIDKHPRRLTHTYIHNIVRVSLSCIGKDFT